MVKCFFFFFNITYNQCLFGILKILQEKEFLKMFQMPVIEVPTNLPNIRKDLPIQAFAVCYYILFFNTSFFNKLLIIQLDLYLVF